MSYVCDPAGYKEPKVAASGFASRKPETVPEAFKNTVTKFPNRPAMAVKRKPRLEDGSMPIGLEHYTTWTWQAYWDDCTKFAKSLIKIGVKEFNVVNILGFNAPEWFIANQGAQLASAIAAGIYTTNLPDACFYITNHSKSKLVVLEDNKQLKKYTNSKSSCPTLEYIVVYNEKPDESIVSGIGGGIKVMTFKEFLEVGSSVPTSDVEARSASVKPGNCSTLIYTSGTTGPPKAVMVSHDNVTWCTANLGTNYMELNHEDRVVSFLPLSHIAAQICDMHAIIHCGGCTYFAGPDALKGTLTITTKEVKPTIFFGVPRVWEKIEEKMRAVGRGNSALKQAIGSWAKGLGAEKTERAQFGGDGGAPMGFGCANAIALSKVKEALGFDQCKGCFTAAAPISPDVIRYFGSLDIPLYEVFGQSECTGPHTVSYTGEWKIGYCGRPMYGTESITVLETGELRYRGRHIFMGYMYDEENTKKTIDADGYLCSGDVAEFDESSKTVANGCKEDMVGQSGFMKITGRIKELIITAGGENIPPVLIEAEVKKAAPALSNVLVVGDKRKYLTMLVSLKCVQDLETGAPTLDLAPEALIEGEKIGSKAKTLTEAAADPLWKEYVDKAMKEANTKTTSAAQKVQKYAFMPKDFSEKDGDLTPTLKLKRSVVNKKYADLIETLYAE